MECLPMLLRTLLAIIQTRRHTLTTLLGCKRASILILFSFKEAVLCCLNAGNEWLFGHTRGKLY